MCSRTRSMRYSSYRRDTPQSLPHYYEIVIPTQEESSCRTLAPVKVTPCATIARNDFSFVLIKRATPYLHRTEKEEHVIPTKEESNHGPPFSGN